MKSTPVTIVAAIVAILAIVAAVLIGIDWHGGFDKNTTPVITTLLSIAAPTITAFLALLKSEQTHRDLTNGTVVRKVKEAVTAPDTLEVLTSAMSAEGSANLGMNTTAKESNDG